MWIPNFFASCITVNSALVACRSLVCKNSSNLNRFLSASCIFTTKWFTVSTIFRHYAPYRIYTKRGEPAAKADNGNRPRAIDFGLRPAAGGFCRQDYNANERPLIWPSRLEQRFSNCLCNLSFPAFPGRRVLIDAFRDPRELSS